MYIKDTQFIDKVQVEIYKYAKELDDYKKGNV
jgi:hypothetical protein